MKRAELRREVDKLFETEKPLAVIDGGRGDLGTFDVQGGEWKKSKPMATLTDVIMEPEHFGRIARLLDRDVDVELELDVATRFIDEDQMQWNTIAEIPGSDKKDEVVMLGAHLDSWYGGTGATDNGAGSVAVMEAMRILKAVGAKPRRTIRIGLWTGEEQGLYGSRGVRRSALRVAPAADQGGRGASVVPPEADQVAADAQARAREARGLLQPRQRIRQDPRHLLRGQRRPSCRSSRPGSRRFTTSARRPSR